MSFTYTYLIHFALEDGIYAYRKTKLTRRLYPHHEYYDDKKEALKQSLTNRIVRIQELIIHKNKHLPLDDENKHIICKLDIDIRKLQRMKYIYIRYIDESRKKEQFKIRDDFWVEDHE
jgi:hypothetical protein